MYLLDCRESHTIRPQLKHSLHYDPQTSYSVMSEYHGQLNFIATYQCLSSEVWTTERCWCDWHDQTGAPASADGSGPPTHGGGSALLVLGQVEEQISANPPCPLGSREWKELHSSVHKLQILITTLITSWNAYSPYSNVAIFVTKHTKIHRCTHWPEIPFLPKCIK